MMTPLLKHIAILGKSYKDCLMENEKSRFQDPDRVLNEEALNREVPSFYITESDLERLQRLFEVRRPKVVWNFHLLREHPARCLKEDAADFHLICVLGYRDLLRYQFLPSRANGKPFLCFIRMNLDTKPYFKKLPFFRRRDVVFFTFDLGDCVLTSDRQLVLSGVTIPSFNEYIGERRVITPNNRYLFSFKGDCKKTGLFGCCQARQELKTLATPASQHRYGYLYVDTNDPGVDRSKEGYMKILHDSTFALVPHGDGRWSHRLVEAIGAGALPLIISDALTLPYEQLIDYSHFCVWVEEERVRRAESMEEILELLPTDRKRLVEMLEKVSLVNETCFRDHTVRINMLLLSALQHRIVNQSVAGSP